MYWFERQYRACFHPLKKDCVLTQARLGMGKYYKHERSPAETMKLFFPGQITKQSKWERRKLLQIGGDAQAQGVGWLKLKNMLTLKKGEKVQKVFSW